MLAYVTASQGMRSILQHLGLPTQPGGLAPAQGASLERVVLSPQSRAGAVRRACSTGPSWSCPPRAHHGAELDAATMAAVLARNRG